MTNGGPKSAQNTEGNERGNSMTIKEMVVGGKANLDLLVASSSIRLTKARKQYLDMVLTDGTDTIAAKFWDWNLNGKPEKNDVISIEAEVSEWAGNKQLTITKLNRSNQGPEQFAPKGDFEIEDVYIRLGELIEDIKHQELKHIVDSVFADYSTAWGTSPGAMGVHHAYVAGALQHSVDAACIAKSIAQNIDGCDVDLCVAGALLHDVGKLFTYALEGALIEYTDSGQLLDHIVSGTLVLERYKRDGENNDIIMLLQHIIASHHGKQEYGSPVTPKFLEAWIVHYSDDIDAKANIISKANRGVSTKYTERVWALNNSSMLSQDSIAEVMNR